MYGEDLGKNETICVEIIRNMRVSIMKIPFRLWEKLLDKSLTIHEFLVVKENTTRAA